MVKLSHLSIRSKLVAGLAGSAIFTLCVGVIGILAMRTINDYTLDIYQGDLVPILRIAEIRQGIHGDESALQMMLVLQTRVACKRPAIKFERMQKQLIEHGLLMSQ